MSTVGGVRGPALGREWHIGKGVIGLLLSSSLAGMAIGAIALSPLADKPGRRAVVLGDRQGDLVAYGRLQQ